MSPFAAENLVIIEKVERDNSEPDEAFQIWFIQELRYTNLRSKVLLKILRFVLMVCFQKSRGGIRDSGTCAPPHDPTRDQTLTFSLIS